MAKLVKIAKVSGVRTMQIIKYLIPLKPGDTLSFGRSQDSDVFLDSTLVKNMISRSHAKLVYDRETDRVTLFDLNSTNGVYVNDMKIDVKQLEHGDRVTFGGRGRSIQVGTIDPQPSSEFIYEFQQESTSDEEETALEVAKNLTDHLQLFATWITTAIVIGSYLFAPEDSEEFSYVAAYVAPLFALVNLPFNRVTFTVSFVVAVLLFGFIAFSLLRKGKKEGKSKAKKQ